MFILFSGTTGVIALQMLLHTGLESFNTVMHKCQGILTKMWLDCPDTTVGAILYFIINSKKF